jgi:hypothetical protein
MLCVDMSLVILQSLLSLLQSCLDMVHKFMHLLNTVVSVQQQSSLCTILNTLHVQRFCDFHNGAPDQTDGIRVFSQFVTLEQFYPCHDLGDFPNLTWSPSFLCMI